MFTNQLVGRLAKKLEPAILVLILLNGLVELFPSGRLVRLVTYAFISFVILRNWKRFSYVVTRDIPLILIVGMFVGSILWSANPSETNTAGKAFLVSTLIGAYLATCYSPRQQRHVWMWVFGLSAVGSLVAIFLGFGHLVDPLKNESMVVGLFNHKNNLGRAGVFATLVFAISYFQNRRQHWFALAGFSASALAIILSETKTSYVTVPVILLAFPIYQILKQHYKLRAVILVATLLIGITASVWIFSNLDYILVDVLGKSESFNGRTGIWSAAIGQALEHPWLGYGLDGFWGSGKDFDLFKGNPVPFWTSEEYIAAVRESKAPSNAHNSYIQMLLEIGFLGVFMYLTSFFTTFTRSLGLFNSTSNPSEKVECLWYLQVLAAIVISGLTTSFLTNGAYWTLYVSIALSTAVQSIRIRHYRRLQKLGGQQSETEVLAT